MSTERPLSAYLNAGWEVQGFSSCLSEYGMVEHHFHLRRQNANKVLSVRRKMWGEGHDTREVDV